MPTWSRALETGHPKIDEQHREIFRRVDALHLAMKSGDRKESGQLIEFLGTYVGEHFAAEERAMKDSGYRGLSQHALEHGQFVREFMAIGNRFDRHGPSAGVAVDLKTWLASWLKDHILKVDVEFARHLERARWSMEDVP